MDCCVVFLDTTKSNWITDYITYASASQSGFPDPRGFATHCQGSVKSLLQIMWKKICIYIYIYIYFFLIYFFFCLLYRCFLHWWLSLSFIVICCGELPNVPNRFKVCTYIFVHTIHEDIFVKSIYILLCQNAIQLLFKCNHVWVWLSTCDVRSGTFSKRLVTANHTHTWWYYVPFITIVVLELNVWSIKQFKSI